MQQNIKVQPLNKMNLDLIPLLIDMSNGDFFKDAEKPTVSELISLVAQYTGKPFGEISTWEYICVLDVANKIITQMTSYEYKEPPMTVNVDGVTYRLILEPQKESAGWWHHRGHCAR